MPDLMMPEGSDPWYGQRYIKALRTMPVHRGGLLPLTEYANGEVRTDWDAGIPGMLNELTSGRGSFWQAGDQAAAGNYRGAGYNGFDAALNVGMGGSVVPRPANAVGIFGGKLAKTADHAALARAEDLMAQGVPREQIWKDTGWFKGVDGKWRFEIDDSSSRMQPAALTGMVENAKANPGSDPISRMNSAYSGYGLQNVLSHPNLAAAYPTTDKMQFQLMKSQRENGLHLPNYVSIAGDETRPDVLRSMFLHETQHHIQGQENLASGANSVLGQAYIDKTDLLHAAEQAHRGVADFGRPVDESVAKAARMFGKDEESVRSMFDSFPNEEAIAAYRRQLTKENGNAFDAQDWYRKNAGEVEARAVQKRMDLTPEQRASRPPWLDYDVPESDQIVRFGGSGPQMSMPEPPPGIRAYHGSPHDFDKFDISKSGTGVGIKSYGHGVELTTSEDVGRIYKHALADPDGGPLRMNANPDGHLYEVRVNAEPQQFMDWQAKIGEQPYVAERLPKDFHGMTGGEFHDGAVQALKDEYRQSPDFSVIRQPDFKKQVADNLNALGIKGVSYVDNDARKSLGSGAKNMTVFDTDIIDIVKKYGIAAAVSLYGLDAVNNATGPAMLPPDSKRDLMRQ